MLCVSERVVSGVGFVSVGAAPSCGMDLTRPQHPTGLTILYLTEVWERFSFYGMKYLLLLYLTKYHLFSDAAGLGVLGSYASLVYAMPVLGGLIADRFIGMRKAVTFGGLLLVAGHLGMAFEGEAAHQTAVGIVRDAVTMRGLST